MSRLRYHLYMHFVALQGLSEVNSLMSVLAGLVILAALIPLLAWAFGRLGNAGFKIWEDQKNEIDNAHLQKKLNQEKPNLLDELEHSEQRGNYDMDVEQLIAQRLYSEARQLCAVKLEDEALSPQRRDMYERYTRIITEQLLSDQALD